MKKVVIMVSGNINHGKDFVADKLNSILWYKKQMLSEKIPTSRVMKEITCDIFDLKHKDLDDFKNNRTLFSLPNDMKIDFRIILQRLGSSMKTYFGETVWAETLKKDILDSEAEVIIVPDLRYPFEFRTLADCGELEVFTVKVFNNEIPVDDSHHSETSMSDFNFDFIIDNTGKPDLTESLTVVVHNIFG